MRSLDEASITRNWDSFIRYLDRRTLGMQTGIKTIDQYLLGLGGVTLIQGDTSSCKSTLALQIAHHNMLKGAACLMFDRENGDGRVRSRLTCQANNISETTLMVATREERLKYVEPVTKLPMYVYTESVNTQEVVTERLAEMMDKHKGPAILLVDSVQAMAPVDDDQRVSLEKWMYFFDALKVQCDGRLTVIVISETKRAGYGSEEGIGRGKGSNSLEFKAETLLDMQENKETGNVWLKIAKHRDGIKGARFELARVLANPANSRSFTFKMEVCEGGLDI